jgi:hypothetical protein
MIGYLIMENSTVNSICNCRSEEDEYVVKVSTTTGLTQRSDAIDGEDTWNK